ncbi:helix-turn-helix domain-containing protein [Epibacterium sp. SM1979]|uniref:Helix-turn-helix domain-containing protein n=1 Tax=Tritonibacter litoralis TaxID=2662264 RepID=A0A843YCX2_9RHOB|nr:helix-turn-helix domain-containing protein [Tritonibacter litoralis]MQQ07173.1 helix-turn-helix domain-containing protein [Tritonibacter litoralis]
MEINVIDKLSALAHENRLALFRLLVRRYPDAVPAGEVAQALGFKANTTSTYLSALRNAGLIDQRRMGTSLCYVARLDGLQGMFDTLLSECCQNRPDVCSIPAHRPIPQPSLDRPLKVLFVCSGNSARSLLAEALLNGEGQGKFIAYSAGTTPSEAPNAEALSTLAARGYDVSRLSSKGLSPFQADDAPTMDLVVTVCNQAANGELPHLPGRPLHAHWGVANPLHDGTQTKVAMRSAFEILKHRIQAFTWLPFDRLDPYALQHRIDEIGHLTPTHSTS